MRGEGFRGLAGRRLAFGAGRGAAGAELAGQFLP